MLLEFEKTQDLLKRYNIFFAQSELVKNKSEALLAAQKIGYPLVLKIFSEQILHKTDVGGVFINIKNQQVFEKMFDNLYQKFGQNKDIKFLVQKFIPGIYIMLGAKIDPTFGPVVLFGLGGIFVEVLKDVSFRLAPISLKDAKEMIKEIKSYQILQGARGQKPINFQSLENALVNLSNLIAKENNIKEIDLNPIACNEKGAIVVDAKIII